MNPPILYITAEDHAKLSLLLSAAAAGRNGSPHQLQRELNRAIILDAQAIPPTVVTMGSRVTIEDLATGEEEEYTLTFPERANVEARQLSVLAPIGTAIIGYRQDDEIEWATPGGTRRIRIRRVVQPPRPPVPTVPLPPLAAHTPV